MSRSVAWLGVVMVAAGCGRLGFPDRQPAPDAVAIDAAPAGDADPLAPLHRYRLDGSLADDLGGPALVAMGGNLDGTGYRFAVNQGLELTSGMPVDIYTIDIKLTFDSVDSWRKIVDFKALALDQGFYVHDAQVTFVEAIAPDVTYAADTPVVAGTAFEATITRDGGGTIIEYVNRGSPKSFTDNFGVGRFTAQSAMFGVDDTATQQREASAGVIREIRIWDAALTAEQISTL